MNSWVKHPTPHVTWHSAHEQIFSILHNYYNVIMMQSDAPFSALAVGIRRSGELVTRAVNS